MLRVTSKSSNLVNDIGVNSCDNTVVISEAIVFLRASLGGSEAFDLHASSTSALGCLTFFDPVNHPPQNRNLKTPQPQTSLCRQSLGAIKDRFLKLYRRRTYVHHYTEYMDQGVFDTSAGKSDTTVRRVCFGCVIAFIRRYSGRWHY